MNILLTAYDSVGLRVRTVVCSCFALYIDFLQLYMYIIGVALQGAAINWTCGKTCNMFVQMESLSSFLILQYNVILLYTFSKLVHQTDGTLYKYVYIYIRN